MSPRNIKETPVSIVSAYEAIKDLGMAREYLRFDRYMLECQSEGIEDEEVDLSNNIIVEIGVTQYYNDSRMIFEEFVDFVIKILHIGHMDHQGHLWKETAELYKISEEEAAGRKYLSEKLPQIFGE